MSARMYNGSSQVSVEDLQFPKTEDLINYTAKVKPVVAMIPPRLIEERSQLQDASSTGSHYKFCDNFNRIVVYL